MGKKKSKSKKINRRSDDDTHEVKRDIESEDVTVCCGLCCVNCGVYTNWDCLGFSGKIGLLCLHCKVCCKCNSYCKQCFCCGPSFQNSGCALCNVQLHGCCAVISGAFPCNDEVPLILNILGLNIYPRCGCGMTIGEIKAKKMDRGEEVPQSDDAAVEAQVPPKSRGRSRNASRGRHSDASRSKERSTSTRCGLTSASSVGSSDASEWWEDDDSSVASSVDWSVDLSVASSQDEAPAKHDENWWYDNQDYPVVAYR